MNHLTLYAKSYKLYSVTELVFWVVNNVCGLVDTHQFFAKNTASIKQTNKAGTQNSSTPSYLIEGHEYWCWMIHFSL